MNQLKPLDKIRQQIKKIDIDNEFEKLKYVIKNDEIESAADRFIINDFDIYKEFDYMMIWNIQHAFIKGAKWYYEQLEKKDINYKITLKK